jgi:outer membrane protein OmpA-like peptidoglycan-associated protein
MKTKLFTLLMVILAMTSLQQIAGANPRKPVIKAVKSTRAAMTPDLKKNLEFDFAKASVRMTYDQKLSRLAEVIKQNNYAIALRGHADAIGKFKPNWVLSQKRADAVKAYLIRSGVDSSKVVATAFGATRPIASNKTPEGRQRNRRVEIIVDPIN